MPQVVLLYPGGAREAFKHRDEQYALLWPDRWAGGGRGGCARDRRAGLGRERA